MDSVHDLGFQGEELPALRLGADIAAGDVNGDGYVDIVIGGDEGYEGEIAWVYLGAETMDTIPDIRLRNPVSSYMSSVCIPGDMNGDGFNDIAACPNPYNRYLPSIYFGGPRMDGIADLYLGESFPDGRIMRLVGGDLDADGFADLIVSGQGDSADHGSVAVYFGSADMDTIPDLEIYGAGSFGEKLAWIGDMTGDGYPEFAVSNPDGAGEIFIYTMGEVSAGQGPVPFPNIATLHVVPNPTRGPTMIGFMTKDPGSAIANIYDLGGRLVRRMESGEHGRGWQQVLWDGNNSLGKAVPAGTYIVRVEVKEQTMTENLVVSR